MDESWKRGEGGDIIVIGFGVGGDVWVRGGVVLCVVCGVWCVVCFWYVWCIWCMCYTTVLCRGVCVAYVVMLLCGWCICINGSPPVGILLGGGGIGDGGLGTGGRKGMLARGVVVSRGGRGWDGGRDGGVG